MTHSFISDNGILLEINGSTRAITQGVQIQADSCDDRGRTHNRRRPLSACSLVVFFNT